MKQLTSDGYYQWSAWLVIILLSTLTAMNIPRVNPNVILLLIITSMLFSVLYIIRTWKYIHRGKP